MTNQSNSSLWHRPSTRTRMVGSWAGYCFHRDEHCQFRSIHAFARKRFLAANDLAFLRYLDDALWFSNFCCRVDSHHTKPRTILAGLVRLSFLALLLSCLF